MQTTLKIPKYFTPFDGRLTVVLHSKYFYCQIFILLEKNISVGEREKNIVWPTNDKRL